MEQLKKDYIDKKKLKTNLCTKNKEIQIKKTKTNKN